jgi:hypothetical protein
MDYTELGKKENTDRIRKLPFLPATQRLQKLYFSPVLLLSVVSFLTLFGTKRCNALGGDDDRHVVWKFLNSRCFTNFSQNK